MEIARQSQARFQNLGGQICMIFKPIEGRFYFSLQIPNRLATIPPKPSPLAFQI
jgi:hypothetical protein